MQKDRFKRSALSVARLAVGLLVTGGFLGSVPTPALAGVGDVVPGYVFNFTQWPMKIGNNWCYKDVEYSTYDRSLPLGCGAEEGWVDRLLDRPGVSTSTFLDTDAVRLPGDCITDLDHKIFNRKSQAPVWVKIGAGSHTIYWTACSWVDTFASAPGYSSPTSTTQTGTLNKGTNYVFCKTRGRKIGSATTYNHWWLKTDLDTGPAAQYVSAYYLSKWGNDEAKDNSGKEIPNC